ncbi:MAG: hypothetical protein PVSMB4_17490 [Ktedonobacterales bacterium]
MSEQVIRGGQIDTQESGELASVAGPSTAPAESSRILAPEPSYYLTGVAFLDSLLAYLDGMTYGKAGLLQRATTYLMVGGFAAVVNLLCLYVLTDIVPMPYPRVTHKLIAWVIASEISILANFIPNDRITFSRLPGHARSWWARCVRFHSTAIIGTLITLVIYSVLNIWVLHWPTLIAESIAIIIALIFNFTFHHLWTYRHVAPAH